MSCLDEQTLLQYLDGTLGKDERDGARAHIAGCSECRVVVSELTRQLAPTRTAMGGFGAPVTIPTAAPVTEGNRFVPGDVVAERYRIVRFVAAGAMGEVYEAHDGELGARIALKFVHPDIASDRRVVERFKRETYFARKVTHPNVCRIFDVGFHNVVHADGGSERVHFLTMEFLDGESLATRLSRGRLSAAEALPLVEQMAAALDAAHGAGIVHRDFKSANVMLVGARAVVTDFGLARGSRDDGETIVSTLDRKGLVGTPAYMAPEQVAGQEAGPAADVYALGVVVFEMMTGRLPFVAATAMLTALQRLQDDAPSPRTFVPSLDATWDATILRCLRRAPEERFASAKEVARALTETAPPIPPPARKPRRWVYGAIALLGATAATGIGLRYRPRPAPAPAPIAIAPVAPLPPSAAPAVVPRAAPPPAKPVVATTPLKPKAPPRAATVHTSKAKAADPLITDYPH